MPLASEAPLAVERRTVAALAEDFEEQLPARSDAWALSLKSGRKRKNVNAPTKGKFV
jgi:hypothetical protein